MIFDVYEPWKNKEGRIVPGVKPHPMEWSEIKQKVLTRPDVREKIMAHHEADGRQLNLHTLLPLAVCHDFFAHVLSRQHLRFNLRPFHGVRLHPWNDPTFLVLERLIHIKYHTPSAI